VDDEGGNRDGEAATSRPGGLRVHVAERADALVAALADELAAPVADPFTADLVAVPTRGVERWVSQRLAHRLGAGGAEDGVCANVRFDSPARVVADVLAATGGVAWDADPWRPENLAWHVLAVIDEHAASPWLRTVARHLGARGGAPSSPASPVPSGDELRAGRRMHLAQRLARLLVAYDVRRPALARSWTAGVDDDGAGAPLPADLAWQPVLWRALVERLGPPPAVRLDAAAARLVQQPGLVDLPDRLHVFGPTALPAGHLTVLAALAQQRDVHLWLPAPSLTLWRAIGPLGATQRRRERPPVARHPMLRSMANDAVELAARVKAYQPLVTEVAAPPPAPTLLGELQTRLRADATDGSVPPRPAGSDDRSVQVHACHGRSRQVEVLRDVVVGLLADDPTLEPRDVIVLCPDVEAFAPLVHAVFGPTPEVPGPGGPAASAAPEHPGRTLRVRIADRSPVRANPVLAVVAALLELADSRVTASAVVDLAGQEPVRRRFALDDEALDRLRAWALESGVHWGEDVERRARFHLGAVPQGTWSAALDRLLLGVAMAEEDQRFVGAVLPVDDVGSSDVVLVGRVAELLDRLTAVLADLAGAHPATHWFDALDRALVLLTAVTPADRWQQHEAVRVLAEARADAAGHDGALRLPDVVAMLGPRLAGRPTRAGFRTGALTVCSLAPMRAVPHRVVVLLGMDDGAFPRGGRRDGDDVLARDPLVGERDRRQEDRQLFLDAVTSATDHLVVLYTGADERTGAHRPPCVPVGELLDALGATATAQEMPASDGPRRSLVVEHPLQPVDPRVFEPGALGRPGPFGFDELDLAAARALIRPRVPAGPLVPTPLPDPADAGTAFDLEDLVRVLEHAPRAFFTQRLGVQLPSDTPQLDDRMPLELAPLARWSIGDRLLTATLEGADLATAADAERRRGHLPPRELGGATLTRILDDAVPIREAVDPFLTTDPATYDVRVTVAGRELTGTVRGVHGGRLVRAVFSQLSAKHVLRSWVQLLALVASDDAGSRPAVRSAVTVGRGRAGATTTTLRAPAPEHAVAVLAELLAVRDEALREPIPLLTKTSHVYARKRWERDSTSVALSAARAELGTPEAAENGRGGFESVDPYHLLAWGEGFELTDVLGEPTPADRAARPEEATRFGALASRVWREVFVADTFEEAP